MYIRNLHFLKKKEQYHAINYEDKKYAADWSFFGQKLRKKRGEATSCVRHQLQCLFLKGVKLPRSHTFF